MCVHIGTFDIFYLFHDTSHCYQVHHHLIRIHFVILYIVPRAVLHMYCKFVLKDITNAPFAYAQTNTTRELTFVPLDFLHM